MFTDARSKTIVFVAHCILNQNAKSDGTASYPGVISDIMNVLYTSNVGIVQMPCPELMCLGLDRENSEGLSGSLAEENTRIRLMMHKDFAVRKMGELVEYVVIQMSEYQKHGFKIQGIVGVNRSPTCGVESTSKENREVVGEGVFIEALRNELSKHGMPVRMVGIKAFEPEQAVTTINKFLANK